MMEMPKYECHKTVSAFQIGRIDLKGGGAAFLKPEDIRRASGVMVSPNYLANHAPKVGGYYIMDDDFCESYSPAEAFEAGYTKL